MRSSLATAKPYWRIVAVALLGALVAFLCSFLVEETYASGTRLLIRGREATFLTTSAEDLSQAPGVIDSSLAKTLGATQAGLVTSRDVAERVVDDLSLDTDPPEAEGFVAWLANAAGEAYARGRALVTFGFYAEPEAREGAIADVQGSLSASALEDSYVLEVVATAETPELARAKADSAADALVAISAERSGADAARNVELLAGQLTQAEADVAAASQALADYKIANDIGAVDTQAVLVATTADELRTQLVQTEVQLQGAQSRLAAIDSALAQVDPTETTTQAIETGRSQTDTSTTGPSAVYQQLSAERASVAGEVADLQTQQSALAGRLGSAADAQLTEAQAQLVSLEQDLADARTAQTDVSARLRTAEVTLASGTVELTRIDTASLPTYPVAPKRYLYLALGLVLGGLAGAWLTRSAFRRAADDDAGADDDVELDLRDGTAEPVDAEAARAPAPVGVGVAGGNGSGNGNGARPEGRSRR